MTRQEELIRETFGNRLLISINEAAPLIGLKPAGFYNRISKGEPPLPLRKLSKRSHYQVHVDDLIEALKNAEVTEFDKPKASSNKVGRNRVQ